MAGNLRSRSFFHGKSRPGGPNMDHHVHYHHPAHSPLCPLFHQPDLHDELHYAVCTYQRIRALYLADSLLVRMLILLAFASAVSWIVRYRFLNMYARLPPEPQRKEPQIDLFPDTQDGDSKPGLANYLDEFLSAIKVFGYRKWAVVRCGAC